MEEKKNSCVYALLHDLFTLTAAELNSSALRRFPLVFSKLNKLVSAFFNVDFFSLRPGDVSIIIQSHITLNHYKVSWIKFAIIHSTNERFEKLGKAATRMPD